MWIWNKKRVKKNEQNKLIFNTLGQRPRKQRGDINIAWGNAPRNYDTALSFADHAGFRCGSCDEYSVYDVVKQQPLKLTERPLIAMECSVMDKRCLGLGAEDNALGQRPWEPSSPNGATLI
jgi:hypothetical protein